MLKMVDRYNLKIFLIILLLFPIQTYASPHLKSVKIGILEPFEIIDSVASERYKDAYLAAIYFAIGENAERLNKCGFSIQVIPAFYSKSNLISAKKSASSLEEQGAWIIIGPTRSNEFVMATKGLLTTPMISPMAGSNEVISLPPPYFTASPGVKKLAKSISNAIINEGIGHTYGTFVDAACSECKDFEKEFDLINSNSLKKQFSLDGVGDTPSTKLLLKELETHSVDFLLLPNYSKFSGHVISDIHKKFPDIKFVGGDGWGQTTWSFFPAYGLAENIIAISSRVGKSDEDMANHHNVYSLNIAWKNKFHNPPHLSYATIEILRLTASDLCINKPKEKEDLLRHLKKQDKNRYRAKNKIGIYKLKNGELQFAYPVVESL